MLFTMEVFGTPLPLSRFIQVVTLLALILTIAPLASDAQHSRPVQLPLGNVWGTRCAAQPEVMQFLGIPFGLPTSGESRFRPPLAYDKPYPKGGLQANRPGPVCPQSWSAVSSDLSEDCLYLNVWAPARPLQNNVKQTAGVPVRVFIHGGAFSFGSASEPSYNGCNTVAATNTIQVNLQYRLGAFGFMGHPGTLNESGVTGNWGLQDQRLGLRWVQENIAAFGGDPERVLLFGESAGGMSVGFQVVMPSSAGLFHAAISESGAPFTIQRLDQAYAATHKFVHKLQCAAQDPAAELACLRRQPITRLLAATPALSALYGPHAPSQVFFPIVDGATLPRQPMEAIAAGAFNRVPYLMGTNRDEGTGFAAAACREGSKGAMDGEDVRTFLQKVFPGALPSRILELYQGNDYRGEPYTPAGLLADLWTDAFMKCPTQRALSGAHSWRVPVWQYLWSHTPSCRTSNGWAPQQGAAHFSEVAFVFGQRFCAITEEESNISEAFMRAWAAMATNRRPILPGGKPWPAWSPAQQSLVLIDGNFTAIQGDMVTKCRALDAAMGLSSPQDLINPYPDQDEDEEFVASVQKRTKGAAQIKVEEAEWGPGKETTEVTVEEPSEGEGGLEKGGEGDGLDGERQDEEEPFGKAAFLTGEVSVKGPKVSVAQVEVGDGMGSATL